MVGRARVSSPASVGGWCGSLEFLRCCGSVAGVCVSVRNLSGTRLELVRNPVWNPSGTRLEPVWNPSGTKLEPVWNSSGTRRERVWNLSGTRVARNL